MSTQQIVQFLIMFLAFGIPAAGALWKKIEEKRQQREIELQSQRSREELLRTGRPRPQAVSQQTNPRAEAAERLAAQRRAQLEELRRRQQERLRQAADRRAAGGQARLSPTARPTGQPARPASRQIPTRPYPAPTPAPQRPSATTVRPQPRPAPPPRVQPQRRPLPRQRAAPEPWVIAAGERVLRDQIAEGQQRALEPDPYALGAKRRRAMTRLFGPQGATADALRRGIMLKEVLDPPLALRDTAGGAP